MTEDLAKDSFPKWLFPFSSPDKPTADFTSIKPTDIKFDNINNKHTSKLNERVVELDNIHANKDTPKHGFKDEFKDEFIPGRYISEEEKEKDDAREKDNEKKKNENVGNSDEIKLKTVSELLFTLVNDKDICEDSVVKSKILKLWTMVSELVARPMTSTYHNYPQESETRSHKGGGLLWAPWAPCISFDNILSPDKKDMSLSEKIHGSNLDSKITRLIVEKNKDTLEWDLICRRNLSESFVDQFVDNIDWESYTKHNCYLENFNEIIERHKKKIDWPTITQVINFGANETFLDLFGDCVDWDNIGQSGYFTEPLLKKYSEKINWRKVNPSKISLEFIEENLDRFNFTDEELFKIFDNRLVTSGFTRI